MSSRWVLKEKRSNGACSSTSVIWVIWEGIEEEMFEKDYLESGSNTMHVRLRESCNLYGENHAADMSSQKCLNYLLLMLALHTIHEFLLLKNLFHWYS